jgi:uncharacterized cofD-like protein
LAQDSAFAAALEHRFNAGDLDGHAFGNLVIAGLADATGDFVGALAEAGRLLGAVGDVLPATIEPVALAADLEDGTTVYGQVEVDHVQPISRLRLVPESPSPPPNVYDAITSADQIVIGPGSLHTSVLAVIAVPAIAAALRAAEGQSVFVANLRGVRSTAGWTLAAHLDALARHEFAPDVVLVDENSRMAEGDLPVDVRVVRAPIARFDISAHDPVQLAKALADLVGYN